MTENSGCITINCACCKGGAGANVPNIGENGNWWIGDEDTGISAQGSAGEKGETGAQGPAGAKGETGAQGPVGPKGDTGDSFDMDTLFSGTAGTEGSVYNLSKPITGYKAVMIEIEGYQTGIQRMD